MNAVLIDDEKMVLNYLEELLQDYETINVIGTFTNPHAGKDFIETEAVDIVFLDINMPEYNGMEIAKDIRKTNPDLMIIFVTAHDEYAVDSFEVQATDYVVKPILKERIDKTIARIQTKMADLHKEPALIINLFNNIQFNFLNKQPVSIQFNMAKVQQLFLYLLHYQSRLVRKEELIDMLWPNLEERKAFSQLYNAIYMIRKEIAPYEENISITTYSDSYKVELNHTVTDVREFEASIPLLPPLTEQSITSYEELLVLYKGNYLEGYDYEWADGERYRLQTLWVNIALDVARWYDEKKEYDKLNNLCKRICDIEPITEQAYLYLMKIAAKRNENSSVHYYYTKLKNELEKEIQEKPNDELQEWYHTWQENVSSII